MTSLPLSRTAAIAVAFVAACGGSAATRAPASGGPTPAPRDLPERLLAPTAREPGPAVEPPPAAVIERPAGDHPPQLALLPGGAVVVFHLDFAAILGPEIGSQLERAGLGDELRDVGALLASCGVAVHEEPLWLTVASYSVGGDQVLLAFTGEFARSEITQCMGLNMYPSETAHGHRLHLLTAEAAMAVPRDGVALLGPPAVVQRALDPAATRVTDDALLLSMFQRAEPSAWFRGAVAPGAGLAPSPSLQGGAWFSFRFERGTWTIEYTAIAGSEEHAKLTAKVFGPEVVRGALVQLGGAELAPLADRISIVADGPLLRARLQLTADELADLIARLRSTADR